MTDTIINTDLTIRCLVPKSSRFGMIEPPGKEVARTLVVVVYGIVQGRKRNTRGHSWVHVNVFLQGDAFPVPIVKGRYYQMTGMPYFSISGSGEPKLSLWVTDAAMVIPLKRDTILELKKDPVLRELREAVQ